MDELIKVENFDVLEFEKVSLEIFKKLDCNRFQNIYKTFKLIYNNNQDMNLKID